MQRLDTTASVDTPERVRFAYRLAGPGQRALAWLVDFALRAALLAIAAGVAALLSLLPGVGFAGMGVLLLAFFLLEWVYGALFEWLLAGRTPGKLVLRLRVVRDDGSPGQLPDFVLRNLLKAADFLPLLFGVGVLTMVLDARMRRLGDLVAGTVVVCEERTEVLGSLEVVPPVSEAERQAMPARITLSPEEAELIESFLRRAPRLGERRAEELAAHFGPALSARSGLEAPSWTRVLTLAYARHSGRDR